MGAARPVTKMLAAPTQAMVAAMAATHPHELLTNSVVAEVLVVTQEQAALAGIMARLALMVLEAVAEAAGLVSLAQPRSVVVVEVAPGYWAKAATEQAA